MSVLPLTSHANSSTPTWIKVGTNSGAKSVAGTNSSTQVTTSLPTPFVTAQALAYTGSGAGTYVITACFKNYTLSATAGTFYGELTDTLTGLTSECRQTEVASGVGSMSCVLTIPNVTGINVKAVVQSSIANSQMISQWSVIYYPA